MLSTSGFRLPTILFLLLLTLGFSSSAQDADGIPTDPSVVAQGEELFKANCVQCHNIHKRQIGPALKDVHTRRTKEQLIAWIRNSQRVIDSGDEYAVALFEEFNRTAMPSYPFSDEQITSILSYIKVESAIEPTAQVDPNQVAEGGGAAATGDSISSSYLTAVLVILSVILVLILIVLALIVSVLTKYLKEKKDLDESEQEVVNQRTNLPKLLGSNAFIGLVVFVFIALVLKTLIDGAFTIGVQQGYMPAQPIAFSHKLHAGDYNIDCNYCHTGVRKAKAANIPSPNICMNCHSAIQNVGENEGISPEIQRIYDAIDFDPQTGQYGNDTRPIEWVRVHNLPDLAYFNHSQHVQVGGVDCETCHGPIREMEVVYQWAPLTMGWCINCHIETEVNTKNNEYYSKLVELHSQHSKEPLDVEDIGGLECSKCHY